MWLWEHEASMGAGESMIAWPAHAVREQKVMSSGVHLPLSSPSGTAVHRMRSPPSPSRAEFYGML